MEFLKRHYEKIILALLLVLFSLLLVGLLSSEVGRSVSPLDMPEMHKVDHAIIDFQGDSRFDIPGQLSQVDQVWQLQKEGREVEGLTSPMLIARCPYCERLLPFNYFDKNGPHNCPFAECGREIPVPDESIAWVRPEYGPGGATAEDLYDDDFDGFSARYELYWGSDPMNPMSHPPLWERLYVTDVKQVELGGTLKVVNAPTNTKENNWYIQVDTPELDAMGRPTGGTKKNLLFLKDKIKLDNREFQVTEITPRYPSDATDAVTAAGNESTARLKLVNGDLELELGVNKPAYYPERKIFMKDLGSKEEYAVDVNDIIVMGNNMIGQVRYKVESLDPEKRTVALIDEMGNRETIREQAIIPPEMRAKERPKDDLRNLGPTGMPLNQPYSNPNMMYR